MAHITLSEAQAWLEGTKLTLPSLDIELEAQTSSEVLGRVSQAYDVSGWTNSSNTPRLVRKIISMLYAGWYYDRAYSETDDTNDYALRLKAAADALLESIVAGITDLEEVPGDPTIGNPAFFPTDESTANSPTRDNPSDGPAAFSMGMRF